MAEPILILGGSVRAAAESARRAGLAPICADLFADLDLCATAERVLPVENLEEDLIRAAGEVPPCPFMFTGALENRPRIVAAIAESRPMWGNGHDALAAVRDPFRLKRILDTAGLPALGVLPEDAPPPEQDGREWIWKPREGAAGRGIRRLGDSTPPGEGPDEPGYFQEFARGPSISAVYVAGIGRTLFVGASRQLVGVEALGASQFGYCGSIGPLELPADMEEVIRCIAESIATDCGLRGVFGCDFIVADGRPLLVEVNPRYPASLEIFERARGESVLAAHRAVFEGAKTSALPPSISSKQSDWNEGRAPSTGRPVAAIPRNRAADTSPRRETVIAKAILYALRPVEVPDLSRFPGAASVWELPYIADRPAAGTHIPKGRPVCTVMANGESEEECAARLCDRVGAVREYIFDGRFAQPDDQIEFAPLDPLTLLDRSILSR